MSLRSSQTLQYGFGYAVFTACRMVRDFTVAAILGPELFGIWAGLYVVRQYGAFSDLGLTNGLSRLVPFALERDNKPEAERAMGQAWTGAIGTTLVFLLAASAIFFGTGAERSPEIVYGVLTLGLLMLLEKHYMLVIVVLRSTRRVGESGLWMGCLGVFELALATLLAWRFSIFGLYIGLGAASLLVVIASTFRLSISMRFAWDRELFGRLIRVSLVLMGFGITNIALHNVDRVAVLAVGSGKSELALYHMGALIAMVVNQVPHVFLMVLSPEIYRHGVEERQQLRRFLLLPVGLVVSAGSAVAVAVMVVGPGLVERLLSQYSEVFTIVGWLVLAEIGFGISNISNAVLVATGNGRKGLWVRGGVVALALAGGLSALLLGSGLGGVAMSMAAAQAIGASAVLVMATRVTQAPALRTLFLVAVPALWSAAAYMAARSFSLWSGALGTSLVLALLLVSAIPFFALVAVYAGRAGPRIGRWAERRLYWARGGSVMD